MVETEIAVLLVKMPCNVLVLHLHVRGSAAFITLLVEAVDSFEMLTCGYQNACHKATILVLHLCIYL
jgi:hypothetical protein